MYLQLLRVFKVAGVFFSKMHFHLLRWRMLPVCVEGGRTVLHSPVGFFPRLKMQVYLQRFSCIVAHVATLTRLQ